MLTDFQDAKLTLAESVGLGVGFGLFRHSLSKYLNVRQKMENLIPLRFLMIFIGILPADCIRVPLLSYVYRVYSIAVQTFFIIFGILQIVDLIQVAFNFTNIYEVSDRMGIALLHTNLIIKLIIMQSKELTLLFKDFDETKARILNGNDASAKRVFLKYSRYTSIITWYYFLFCWISIIALISSSFIKFMILWDVEKDGPDIPLPLHSYKPFDIVKYYSVAFWIDVAAAHYTSANYTVSHSLLSGLILFYVGQIKIFKNCLKNFSSYSKSIRTNERTISDEEKELKLIGCFVREHLIITRNVKVLNSQFQFVSLLEFLVMSVQLAFQLFQLLTAPIDIEVIFKVFFLMLNTNQVFIFSYQANEIVVESSDIPNAIFESEWYNRSTTAKKSFIFMMMNSRKPLELTLGPFATVTAANSVNILKAAYSYTMLLMKT